MPKYVLIYGVVAVILLVAVGLTFVTNRVVRAAQRARVDVEVAV